MVGPQGITHAAHVAALPIAGISLYPHDTIASDGTETDAAEATLQRAGTVTRVHQKAACDLPDAVLLGRATDFWCCYWYVQSLSLYLHALPVAQGLS